MGAQLQRLPDVPLRWVGDLDRQPGHRYTFTPDGQGGLHTPTTIFGTLTVSAAGYTFRAKDGLVHQFDPQGRLIEIRDRNGNALDVAYDANGHITTVTEADAPERQLIFTYTGNHITAVSDGTGRTWTYSYTGNELTEADAPSDAQTPQATVRYDYYTDTALGGLLRAGHRAQRRHVAVHLLRQPPRLPGDRPRWLHAHLLVQPLPRPDRLHRRARQHHAVRLQRRRGPRRPPAPGPRPRDVRLAERPEAVGHRRLRADRDLPVRRAGEPDATVDRPRGNVTTMTYDPTFSQVTSITQPGGRVTQYDYDANGNLLTQTDALDNVTTMTYDGHGLMLSVTRPRGNQTATPGDFTTTYTYNDAGQVLTRSTDLPSVESFTYDARGHTDLGHRRAWEYHHVYLRPARPPDLHDRPARQDEHERLRRHRQPHRGHGPPRPHHSLQLRPQAATRRNHQPGRNHPDRRSSTRPATSRRRPTNWGVSRRPCSMTATARSIRSTPTAARRRPGTTAAVGSRPPPIRAATRPLFAYDTLGRLVRTIDALGGTTTRTYDAVGNLTSITDPLNRTTRFGYDLLNRQVSTTDPLDHTTTTAYDADGNVISVTDPLGHATQYGYDVLDRPVVRPPTPWARPPPAPTTPRAT